MKFLFILLLITSNSFAQNTLIKGKNFEGCIFVKEEFVPVNVPNEKSRYTPDSSDIFIAEKYLRDSIKHVIQTLKKQPDMKRKRITKRYLKKYYRQYVGFLNKNNEKVIWINFIRSVKSETPDYSREIIWIYDGGSNNWNLLINIDTGEVSNMTITSNGFARN